MYIRPDESISLLANQFNVSLSKHARSIIGLTILIALLLSACSDGGEPAAGSATATPIAPSSVLELQKLTAENTLLRAEVKNLATQVEDLRQTPQVLLQSVQAHVGAGKLPEAQGVLTKLTQRYGEVPQAKEAKALVAKLESDLQERAAMAQRLEAMGFYALKPSTTIKFDSMAIKVDSLKLGTRWDFDDQEMESYYRDAKRGEKFVLLRTTFQSLDKSQDPNLPEVAVYAIEGKTMRRLASMGYEFRRWSSYGTYIGLHHDFKNDFAHTSSIPFNGAASISEEAAKLPFAVVATGHFCHERGEAIGQPDIRYRRSSSCPVKDTLTAEDFNTGGYRVMAFFNKPKGL
jgi:hypothetical protein